MDFWGRRVMSSILVSMLIRSSLLVTATLLIAIGHSVCATVCCGLQEESEPPAPPLVEKIEPARKLHELRGDPLMQIIEQRLTPESASLDDKPKLLDGAMDRLDRLPDDKVPVAIEPKPADGDKTVNRPMRLKRDSSSAKQVSVGQLQAAEGMIRSARQLEKEAARAERAGQPQRAKALREIGSSLQSNVVKLLQLGG
jgi:hypothetical protein